MTIRYCAAALAFFSLYISPVVLITYCGNGEMKIWGQHCYFFSYPVKTWTSAKSKCEAMNATLASIHSQEEQDYITKAMRAQSSMNYWIGMKKDSNAAGNKENYTWIDGTQVDYENWKPDEPGGSSDCVTVWYYNVWEAKPCTYSQEYVCKAPVFPALDTTTTSTSKPTGDPTDEIPGGGGGVVGDMEAGGHVFMVVVIVLLGLILRI